MSKRDIGGFQNVDGTDNPGFLVDYLDTVGAMDAVHAYKRQTFAVLEAKEGHHILDVGCGAGDDVRMLAKLVGNNGRAVGVDKSEIMISEARQRSGGLSPPVAYRVCDVHNLEFDNDTFHGCRADRTFQHLETPRKAMAEMIRVTRPGGRIVISEPDWETLVVDTPDHALTRKILNFGGDSLRHGWMGRRLLALFKGFELINIAVVPATVVITNYPLASQVFQLGLIVEGAQKAGVATKAESAKWLECLEKANQAGRFFSAMTGFIVSGRKP